MRPALDHLAEFEDIDGVRRRADKFASAYTIPALAAYRAMPPADRDALTVGLAELSARFAVRHRGAAEARHELEGPVAEAYDLIVNVPEINPTPEGVWNGGR
ncbi:hypothetical protein ACQPZJ_28660 [Actinoplanes sp. CA-054009]